MSHLLKERKKKKKTSSDCNSSGTISHQSDKTAGKKKDKHAACGHVVQKSSQKVSKTTVFPHDLFYFTPPQLSGYASWFQDDSLTTSFQELNQSADNEELDRRKQKRGKGIGHTTGTTAK